MFDCPVSIQLRQQAARLSASSLAVAVELFVFAGLRPPYLIFEDEEDNYKHNVQQDIGEDKQDH